VTKPVLMVVDDNESMAKLVSNVGEIVGFDVRSTFSAKEFQEVWSECDPSAIVLDLVMPDMDGIEILDWLAEQKCSAPIILMSGYEGKYVGMANSFGVAKGDKVVGSLTKPYKVDQLEMMLKDIFETV